MWKRFAGALVLVMVTATVLLAHDLFLKLETYFVPPETAVRVAVLSGTFASSEGAVSPDRLQDLSIVGPNGPPFHPPRRLAPDGRHHVADGADGSPRHLRRRGIAHAARAVALGGRLQQLSEREHHADHGEAAGAEMEAVAPDR